MCARRSKERIRTFVEIIHRFERIGVGFELTDAIFDDVACGLSATNTLERDTFWDGEIADFETALAGIRVEVKWAVGAAEEAGGSCKAVVVGDGDIGRKFAAAAEFMRDDGAHLRVVDHGRRGVAGEEVVGGLLVIGDAADDTAKERELVGNGSGLWKIVAEDLALLGLHHAEGAAIFGGGFGFGIERFLLGQTATKVKLNDAEGFGLELFGAGRGVGFFCAGLKAEHVTQGKAEAAE